MMIDHNVSIDRSIDGKQLTVLGLPAAFEVASLSTGAVGQNFWVLFDAGASLRGWWWVTMCDAMIMIVPALGSISSYRPTYYDSD